MMQRGFRPVRGLTVLTLALTLGGCSAGMESADGLPVSTVDGWSDARVATVVHTANHGEIEQGRQAVERATDGRVKQFAQRMIDDHTSANQQLTGIVPMGSMTDDATANQLEQGARMTLSNLATFTGADYDRAYMDNQVVMHRWVLNSLDQVLIPGADSPALRTRLQAMRTSVAEHLRLAEEIQQSLGR